MSSGILVINAGSSSLKFAVFVENSQPEPELLVKGQMEGLGSDPSFQVKDAVGTVIDERDEWPRGSTLGHADAMRYILDWLGENASRLRVVTVGVTASSTGGLTYDRAVRIDDRVMAELEKLAPLAPLHQPHNLAAIRALTEVDPALPQVACFDTAFHRTQVVLQTWILTS